MGRRSRNHRHSAAKSHTLPSSPTHSSSSSDFEFTISISPHKSAAALCPADELFYKGKLLPLHLSPRLSMVRTLLLSSPSSSSTSTTTTSSRDSTASDSSSTDLLHHHDCYSSRPSSVADDEFKTLCTTTTTNLNPFNIHTRKPSKYFSLSKFSSVFRKEHKNPTPTLSGAATVKRVSSSAKDVIRRYFKKVKPLYEKLSQKQQKMSPPPPRPPPQNISFSGNLVFPRRRSSTSSCPSSIGSSPTHGRNGFGLSKMGRTGPGTCHSDASSMEELQSAIQSAIAHCKNSMLRNNNSISNEI